MPNENAEESRWKMPITQKINELLVSNIVIIMPFPFHTFSMQGVVAGPNNYYPIIFNLQHRRPRTRRLPAETQILWPVQAVWYIKFCLCVVSDAKLMTPPDSFWHTYSCFNDNFTSTELLTITWGFLPELPTSGEKATWRTRDGEQANLEHTGCQCLAAGCIWTYIL